MLNNAVEYRGVDGFPGYRVGSDGTVWSQWRIVGLGRGRGNIKSISDGRWKKLKPQRRGLYHGVTLYPGAKHVHIHRLVLSAFVGPRPDGLICCHNNGNRDDNRRENLRYDTHVANARDRLVHGTVPFGERHSNAKLTNEAVKAIRAEYALEAISQSALARKYGVTQTLIGQVVRRCIWQHVA